MDTKKKKIEYNGLIIKLWKDPVLSKIIATGLIILIGLLLAFFASLFEQISFKEVFCNTIMYKIEIYKIFTGIITLLIIYIIIYKLRLKRLKNKKIGRFNVEQKVGHFTFRELYNALLTNKIETPTNIMGPGIENKIDLLSLFVLYQRQFNLGSEWQGDYYTHYKLGPTLMTYGLTEKVPATNKLDDVGSEMIQTSKTGFKFHALLEQWRVFNDELLKDDITKIQGPEPKDKKE